MDGMTPSQFCCICDKRADELIVMMGSLLEGKTKKNAVLDMMEELEKECYSIPEVLWIGWMLGQLM